MEHLQQTILDHRRVEFRRRYLTKLRQHDIPLQSYLHFYHHKRADHGYRTRGRTRALSSAEPRMPTSELSRPLWHTTLRGPAYAIGSSPDLSGRSAAVSE